MKLKLTFCFFLILIIIRVTDCRELSGNKNYSDSVDFISAFKDTLNSLASKSENEFFKIHCNSIISVIEGKNSLTHQDSSFIIDTYNAFNNNADTSNPKQLSTYLKQQRPFIISWVSPTDGAVSLSWVTPPKNWDPEKEYPLYIELHGFWNVASGTIEYMTYPFLSAPYTNNNSILYEDGYKLSPWGRGNLWYEGVAETDIWESITALENIVKIDPSRKYLQGFSMGGYGALLLATKSPNTWAALGIHAGAFDYDNYKLVTHATAEKLKDLPTYIVVGTSDGALVGNHYLYQLLGDVGNSNIKYVQFNGGHDYIQANVDSMYLWMRNFVNEDWNTSDIKNTDVLSQQIICYPNPVKSIANIQFSVSKNSNVSLSVYDIYGRMVDELVNETKTFVDYKLTFDASGLSNGLYIIRLKTGNVDNDLKFVVEK